MNYSPYANASISVGKGLLGCKLFFLRLWPLIEPKLPPKGSEEELYEMHEIFCTIVCSGYRASVEWIESIHRAKKLSKEQQQHFRLTLDDQLSCMIEFCKIYDKRYDGNLSFLLKLLDSMKDEPSYHQREWQLLHEVIGEVNAQSYTPFLDWEATFTETEQLSVEEAFVVCTSFFLNLWLLLDPSDSLDGTGLYATYYNFCQCACGAAVFGINPEGHAEWNEIIFRLKTVPKKQQQTLKLSTEDVFLCMNEFCKLYNKKYELQGLQYKKESNLHLIIKLLNSMLEFPKKHRAEWLIFKRPIAKASNGLLDIDFDWNAKFDKEIYNE